MREAAGRVLGQRHYDSQLIAGWWLLGGHLAEMATGEGKTLAATLPGCAAALAGLPVHVVTVNDYLAARDAQAMGPLYAFFGLRCSAVVHDMSRAERCGPRSAASMPQYVRAAACTPNTPSSNSATLR